MFTHQYEWHQFRDREITGIDVFFYAIMHSIINNKSVTENENIIVKRNLVERIQKCLARLKTFRTL